MVFYLRHPVYGEKVATSEREVKYDIQQGWELFNPVEPAPPKENNLKRKRKE